MRARFWLVLAVTVLPVVFFLSQPVAADSSTGTVNVRIVHILDQPASQQDSGPARLVLKITSGSMTGDTVVYQHFLWGHPLYDPPISVGQSFVAELDLAGDRIRRVQLGQTRKDHLLLLLFVALCLGLLLVAGWEGLIGLGCSLGTLAGVLFVFFPIVLTRPVILSAGVALCLLTILITVSLVLKLSPPVIPAVSALSIVTLLITGISVWGMWFLHLDPSQARHNRLIMTYLNRASSVTVTSLQPLLVVGIVLGTLGAMMDVAVVISSTVHEIVRDEPTVSLLDGFYSGMRVGREILSTMVNTLTFAYMGILLPVLTALHIYELSWLQFLNYSFVGIEILRICVGFIGLSLIIPATAGLSAWWFNR